MYQPLSHYQGELNKHLWAEAKYYSVYKCVYQHFTCRLKAGYWHTLYY